MTKTVVLTLGVVVALAVPGVGAPDIHQLLRSQSPDFADLHQRMSALQTHADALTQSLSAFVKRAEMVQQQIARIRG